MSETILDTESTEPVVLATQASQLSDTTPHFSDLQSSSYTNPLAMPQSRDHYSAFNRPDVSHFTYDHFRPPIHSTSLAVYLAIILASQALNI